MSEIKSKKMVSLNVAVALGMIFVAVVAGLGIIFSNYVIDANNKISSLNNQISSGDSQLDSTITSFQDQTNQLLAWLNGNETLLTETETWLVDNVTYYNSQITNLQNQESQLQTWLNGNITIYETQINLLNSIITSLQNQIADRERALGSVWVSPSTIAYSTDNASVGTLFNVTVWANMQNGTYNWQVTMKFNASVFQEVACGYTAGTASAYFAGHATVPVSPVVDNVAGSIVLGESLIGNDYAPEENASLMYAEFNITTMPTPTKTPLTGLFDINATGTSGTFFDDTSGNTFVSAANLYDASFALYSLIVPPTISNISQVPDINSVNPGEAVTVSANVTDNSGTGIANVTLVYSNDTWATNSTAAMTLNSTTGLYYGTIPGYAVGTGIFYVIDAYDNSGGFSESIVSVWALL
jgi:hypothetical protein